jgi:pseudouridine kinase
VDIKAKTVAHHIHATSNPAVVHIKAGGVARNIAHNIAKLGGNISLLTIVGNDANGDFLLAQTKSAGVDVSLVERSTQSTGTYIAVLDQNGELITAVNAMLQLTAHNITQHITTISRSKMVVADCNLDVEAMLCIENEVLIIEPVSVPKCHRLLQLLKQRSVFLATPNLDQIEALTGTRNPAQAAKTLHGLGLQNVVIHAGAQGSFASNGMDFFHLASSATHIVDVTGAGDAATAGLVFGLSQNLPLEKAAALGQKSAARVLASAASTLE